MKKRPMAVTVVSWLMIAGAGFGLVRGFMNAKTFWPPERDLIWIVVIDTIGIACGVFMLRGKNWARWLTVLWLAGHVALASQFMRQTLLAHLVILALIAYLLIFRPDVREYFRPDRARAA
jgi:hypothetical protein